MKRAPPQSNKISFKDTSTGVAIARQTMRTEAKLARPRLEATLRQADPFLHIPLGYHKIYSHRGKQDFDAMSAANLNLTPMGAPPRNGMFVDSFGASVVGKVRRRERFPPSPPFLPSPQDRSPNPQRSQSVYDARKYTIDQILDTRGFHPRSERDSLVPHQLLRDAGHTTACRRPVLTSMDYGWRAPLEGKGCKVSNDYGFGATQLVVSEFMDKGHVGHVKED